MAMHIVTDQGALNELRAFLDSLLAKDPTTYPAGLGNANEALLTLAGHHAERREALNKEAGRL